MEVRVGWKTVVTFLGGVLAAGVAYVLLHGTAANALTGGESTFVPTAPCRLFDTRPAPDNVGERAAPLGGREAHAFQVTGTNGECTVPAEATAIAINLTGVLPTAATYLAAYPSDVDNPGTSVVNMTPGQAALPNKIDVALSPDGRLTIFNGFGTIDVVGDVLGYYRSDGLADLATRVAALEAGAGGPSVAALQGQVTTLQADLGAATSRIQELEAITEAVSLETVDGQPTIRFTGVNVQIVDGSGDTDGSVNGRGNLIVGYAENSGDARTGSHNLVVGRYQSYAGYGGLLGGENNSATGAGASATGGYANEASGFAASVGGGYGNVASGPYASVGGGESGVASGGSSSVGGGYLNQATGLLASVSGGQSNTASQWVTWVGGGLSNTAGGDYSSVSGGSGNSAGGAWSSVSGGEANSASGSRSSIGGGQSNIASGVLSAVSGGQENTAQGGAAVVVGGYLNFAGGGTSAVLGGTGNGATGAGATVSGGWTNSASNTNSTVSGGSFNAASGLNSAVSGGYNRTATGERDWWGGGLFQDS